MFRLLLPYVRFFQYQKGSRDCSFWEQFDIDL